MDCSAAPLKSQDLIQHENHSFAPLGLVHPLHFFPIFLSHGLRRGLHSSPLRGWTGETSVLRHWIPLISPLLLQSLGWDAQKPDGIGIGGPIWACLFDDSGCSEASVESADKAESGPSPEAASAEDAIHLCNAVRAVRRW